MRAIDDDEMAAALQHAGELAPEVRGTLEEFVALSPDLRAPFAALLERLTGGSPDVEGLHEGLGGDPADNRRYLDRLAETREAVGAEVYEEALIRFGFAEGAALSPDGQSVRHGPPANPEDRARALKEAPGGRAEPELLSLEEARAAIGSYSVGAIMEISSAMTTGAAFGGYARRLVEHLEARGLHLGDEGRWEEDTSEAQDSQAAAERLAHIALDGDDGGALMRQTRKLVDKETRLAFTLEALYDEGYRVDAEHRVVPPGRS